ncbi:MAG: TetR/AcrR family transcriptional regulator [Clostridia bacterium]|nr:TetR/AcrR family transcriptional regulator [Bacillota bacterium]MCI9086934.1 TetR/AcrR family transcriptional regulator [Clostridia bacterium]
MTNRQCAALDTKNKLLEAGKNIICQKGLINTSVEEITRAAGVSKGTFYTYFKRKEDIVFELSFTMFDKILKDAKAFNGNFLDRLENYMVKFSEYIEQNSVKMAQDWVRNVVNPNLSDDKYDRGKLQSDLDSVYELIDISIKEGLLKEDTPAEQLSQMLIDLLYGQMFCWSMSDGVYSLKEHTQKFCDTYLELMFNEYITEANK